MVTAIEIGSPVSRRLSHGTVRVTTRWGTPTSCRRCVALEKAHARGPCEVCARRGAERSRLDATIARRRAVSRRNKLLLLLASAALAMACFVLV